jgi:hypothetical protein
MQVLKSCILAVVALQSVFASYYLPGVTPNYYETGEKVGFFSYSVASSSFLFQVTLQANKVTSTKTPVQYEYYDLPFCKRGRSKSKAENLGERLSGDTTTASPYEVSLYLSFLVCF